MDLEYKHRHIKSNRMEKDTPCSTNQKADNTYVNIKVDLRTRNNYQEYRKTLCNDKVANLTFIIGHNNDLCLYVYAPNNCMKIPLP